MNLHQFKHFTAAACLGVAAAIPGPAVADDTEIYLGSGQVSGQQVRPNVLFVLDTSGSMSGSVSGTGMDRLDNMKQALEQILTNANNINVGLMRFTDPGGPILFPVSNIDANADTIEGIADSGIVRSIDPGSNNDAQELNTGLTTVMSTSDDTLTLGALTTATGGTDTVTVTTTQDLDTQEERLSDGYTNSGGSYVNMNLQQINGIRFPNVDVPNSATITSAYFYLTAPQNTSGDVTLNFWGELPADGDADAFTTSRYTVSSRTTTAAKVAWVNPPAFATNDTYKSPDISAIIQEIVNDGNWAKGQAMALIEQSSTPASGSDERSTYTHKGAGGNESREPRLEINYSQGAPVTGTNTVGLRFDNIGIPQGVTILSATLEFTAKEDSTDPTLAAQYRISAEKVDDSAEFLSADSDNISSRTQTTANVVWDSSSASNPLTEWTKHETYVTPDLTAVVQEVVNQGGWCGNNSMTLMVEDAMLVANTAVARKAYSSDFVGTPSDPGPDGDTSTSPVLRIKYDYDSVPAAPGGCLNQIIQRQVAAKSDDAEQYTSGGSMMLNGTAFDMRSNQINGLRFQDIQIPQGANILEATLTLNARNNDSGTSNITWYGQASDDASTFSSSKYNISNRTKTSASVTESLPDWEASDTVHVTSDLSSIVQEIVNRGGWAAGNDLVLIQTASSGHRRAKSFNESAFYAPVLRIKVEFSGSHDAPLYKTVRERLIEIVDDLPHQGYTPIVGTLYEAALYYRGEGVHHGKHRSHYDSYKAGTRISHAASFTGGTIDYPAGCTEDNLGSSNCKNQHIDGDATYISPIDVGCQANYIVLLTDGEANHNQNEGSTDHGVSLVESMVPGTCAGSGGRECGLELTQFLAQQDQRADMAGSQTVKTYTIGFNFSSDWLKELADADHGGGAFYEATSASDLVDKFEAILADILSKPTSFATPSLSVNAFNKLFHRNEVYFSLFTPSNNVAWDGNVKKYRICDLINITSCTLGEIVDANDVAAIGADNRILDSATSVWSTGVDGIDVRTGGASENIPTPYTARTVYTYTGGSAPDNVDLTQDAHTVDGDISDTDLTKDMLGDSGMSNQDRLDLIAWIRGNDVDDVDNDAGTIDRYTFEDPLHASPVAVTFGGTEADPVDKLFVATNGGGLRMLNAKNGEEEWIFFPQSELSKQSSLRENAAGDHIYGLDLTPSVWQYDVDSDGVIETADGDFVRVIQAMRRGGNNIYMIDATPATPLNDSDLTTGIDPTLVWRIEGGVTTGFENLGQTWSQPLITEILTSPDGTNIVKDDVIIFGGGNDPDLDKQFDVSGSNTGNIIYVVDAEDGSLITSIGGTGTTAKHTVTGMNYPIVSDLSLLDSNGDGATDRIYFGDLGGNVWRIDLKDTLRTISVGSDVATVGKLANFSLSEGAVAGDHDENTRKFYSAPDVVQVYDAAYSNESRYDLVFIGSGSRPDPLNTVVHNRFYAIRDYVVDDLPDTDSNGIADTSCPSSPCADGESEYPVRTLTDLADLTSNPLQLDIDGTKNDESAYDAALDELRGTGGTGGYGWYLNMQEIPGDSDSFIGEKVLSKPVVLAGKLFFTTYIPIVNDVLQNSCELSEGTGRLWGLNALTGAALFEDWDNNGGSLSDRDRYYELGGGIPSDAVPIFQKKGVTIIVGGGGGATTVDPGINLPRERTYWLQREAE